MKEVALPKTSAVKNEWQNCRNNLLGCTSGMASLFCCSVIASVSLLAHAPVVGSLSALGAVCSLGWAATNAEAMQKKTQRHLLSSQEEGSTLWKLALPALTACTVASFCAAGNISVMAPITMAVCMKGGSAAFTLPFHAATAVSLGYAAVTTARFRKRAQKVIAPQPY